MLHGYLWQSAFALHMQELFQFSQQDDKIESERLVADVSDESAEGSIGLTHVVFDATTSVMLFRSFAAVRCHLPVALPIL